MSIVICHTPDCTNDGVPLELDLSYLDPETGETRHVDAVVCGPCGQPITDIQEVES